jgi:DNA-binding beta-propeller fold protein YncE
MAKELQPGQELKGGDYTIVKTLTFTEQGGVYVAKERESGQMRVLKELIPPPDMGEEEVARRSERLSEAMLVLTQFDHPNLARIYGAFSEGRRHYVVMERVDGITLKSLVEMSVKALPESQVLKWAISLANAIHYLYNRPQAYVFNALEPANIMITPREELKLINFGLDRFFWDQEDPFGATRKDKAAEMKAFAETVVFLLTRKEPGPFGLIPGKEASPELAGVINRCLSGDEMRVYATFEEMGQALDRVLNPPPKAEAPKRRGPLLPAWVKVINFRKMWEDALWSFFAQPLYVVVLEVVGLLVAISILWYVTHPPVRPRPGGLAAYVAAGGEIDVIMAADRKLLSRLLVDRPVTALAATPDGLKLFAASPEASLLYVLNARSNRVIGSIRTERAPTRLLIDPRGEWLYVLHSQSGLVEVTRLDRRPLPMSREADPSFKLTDSVVGVVPAGPEAYGIALDPGTPSEPAQGASPAASPQPSPQAVEARLYVTSQKLNRVLAVQPQTQKLLGQARVEGAGAAALSADRKRLYVVQPLLGRIAVLDTGTLSQSRAITETGGTRTSGLILSPDGLELWCLNDNNLGVINTGDGKVRATVTLNGRPSDAGWAQIGQDLRLWVALEDRGEVAIVNPLTRQVEARVPVARNPTGLVIVP